MEIAILAVVVVGFFIVGNMIADLRLEVKKLEAKVGILTLRAQSRQSQIGISHQYGSLPTVDRPARTTRRDTDDLPRTARQSSLKRRDEGGDNGLDPDDRLQ